nr:methyltransferase domain-containing protein [uncultured bacterium]
MISAAWWHMHGTSPKFSAELFFETVNGYYRTAALKTAIELDLFSAVGESRITSTALAEACKASPRGVRILSDYLVAIGFLCKSGDHYFLTRDMLACLSRNSPGYIGGTIEFLLSPQVTGAFDDLTAVVRTGAMTRSKSGALDPEHPQWITFARVMQPLMALPSFMLADLVDGSRQPLKVLDVAAGHGLFGLAFAIQNPHAEVTALDWSSVLRVARENAESAGVIDRFRFLPGDAFEVAFGTGYDVVLFANFLHHFDRRNCEALIAKAHQSLAPNGRVITFEFIANEDKVSPPMAATFSMMMLGTTPGGEVYSYSDLEQMFAIAGFARSECHDLHPVLEKVVVSYK